MPVSASTTARQNELLNEWANFQKPALNRILLAGLSLVSAMDDYRATQLWADVVEQHDAYAVDTVGMILDQLNDAIGGAQKAVDDLGINVDLISLDVSELVAAFAKLKARSDARTPKPLHPAAVALLAQAAE